MRLPYFKNGMSTRDLSTSTGIKHCTIRGYIQRYRIPSDYYNPEKLLIDIHSEHRRLREMGIRPLIKSVSRMVGYNVPKKRRERVASEAIYVGDNNSKKTLAVLIRSIEKHSLYSKVFGVDTRDELADVKNKILDELLME